MEDDAVSEVRCGLLDQYLLAVYNIQTFSLYLNLSALHIVNAFYLSVFTFHLFYAGCRAYLFEYPQFRHAERCIAIGVVAVCVAVNRAYLEVL